MNRPITAAWIFLLVLLAVAAPTRVGQAEEPALVLEARELLGSNQQLLTEFREFEAKSESERDVDFKAVAVLQARRHLVDWMRNVDDLVSNVLRQREQGLDGSKFLQQTRSLLWSVERRLPGFIDELVSQNFLLRGAFNDAATSSESLVGIEALLRGNEETIDETVRFYVSHIEQLDQLKMGSTRARDHAAVALENRAVAWRRYFNSQAKNWIRLNSAKTAARPRVEPLRAKSRRTSIGSRRASGRFAMRSTNWDCLPQPIAVF